MTQRVYLDANILIAHQVRGHEFHRRATSIIDELWNKKCHLVVSSLTMDEFFYGIIFILKSTQKEKTIQSFGSFAPIITTSTSAILSWERLETIEFKHTPGELLSIVKLMGTHNLRPRDAFHLRTMQQQEITQIATFDNDFDGINTITIIK